MLTVHVLNLVAMLGISLVGRLWRERVARWPVPKSEGRARFGLYKLGHWLLALPAALRIDARNFEGIPTVAFGLPSIRLGMLARVVHRLLGILGYISVRSLNLRLACVAMIWVSSSIAANVPKLRRDCREHNAKACNKLIEIAKSQKEHTSNRVGAIQAISDRQTLQELRSDQNSGVKAAAANRLKEFDTADLIRSIDKGDVAGINALAAKGVEIDPHSSIRDVEDIQQVSGGFSYKIVRRRGPSSVLVRALRSGHPESVEALVALGSDVKSPFYKDDMNLGFSSFMSPDMLMDQAELGLPGGVSGPGFSFQSNRDGSVTCTVRPQPATKSNYVSLAEQMGASAPVLALLRRLSGTAKVYGNASLADAESFVWVQPPAVAPSFRADTIGPILLPPEQVQQLQSELTRIANDGDRALELGDINRLSILRDELTVKMQPLILDPTFETAALWRSAAAAALAVQQQTVALMAEEALDRLAPSESSTSQEQLAVIRSKLKELDKFGVYEPRRNYVSIVKSARQGDPDAALSLAHSRQQYHYADRTAVVVRWRAGWASLASKASPEGRAIEWWLQSDFAKLASSRDETFLLRLAESGSGQAFSCLSEMYSNGYGVAKDLAKAGEFAKKAVDVGYLDEDRVFLYTLRYFVTAGENVPEEKKLRARLTAVTLLQDASKEGDAESLELMVGLLTVLQKSTNDVTSIIKGSAENGNSRAMLLLGKRYSSGTGVSKNEEQSLSLFQKAVDAGDAKGLAPLATTFLTGLDHGEEVDWFRAIIYARRGAENGNSDCMYVLGGLYWIGWPGHNADHETGMQWMRKAAAAGHSPAKAFIARWG